MGLPSKTLYKFSVQNLQSVEIGLTHVERQLRACLKSGDDVASKTFSSLYLLLIGVWSEARFRKLLHEQNGFSDGNRENIAAYSSKLEQWKCALKIGFEKKYNKSIDRIPKTAKLRYLEMETVLESELKGVIEIRNKLAHGQWAIPLTNREDDISVPQKTMIENENYLKSKFRYKMLGHFSDALHDLVSSENAFERDFDKHYELIENTYHQILNKDYNNWLRGEREKYKRGLQKRNKNDP